MRRFVIAMAVIVGLLFGGVILQGLDNAGGSYAPQPARKIAFKEAVLDGHTLAQQQARVEIVGMYQGLSADIEMLYPPNHSGLGLGDDTLRLWTENSPRQIRELFYGCRQRSSAALNAGDFNGSACIVRLTGYMTTCYLKIATSAQFPCLAVETAAEAGD